MSDEIVVLLADDNARRRTTLSTLSQQFKITPVDSSDDCLLLHSEADVIVLSQTMRGWDTVCRQIADETPVLLLTGAGRSDSDDGLDAGATDIIASPFSTRLFEHRLRLLVEQRRAFMDAESAARRWQQAFELNRAVKLLVDPSNGQIVDANPAAAHFYGFSRDELRHMQITDLDAPPTGEVTESTPQWTLFNFRHRLKSGEIRHVKIFSSPLDDHGRTLIYMIVYDITKRRRAEAAEQDQRTLAEALRKTAAALSSSLELNEVMDRILQQVQHVVPHERGSIILIDGGVARVVRSRADDEIAYDEEHESRVFVLQETPTLQWMIVNRNPLVIPDVSAYPGWTPAHVSSEWMRSYLGAPIRIGRYVIGFLNLDSSLVDRFHRTDAERLQSFADQAGIAIRNARLFEQVREQAQELENRVIERTTELEYERRQLRTIIEGLTEGVAFTEYVDKKFRTLYVNRALERMTGYNADEWNMLSVRLLKPPQTSEERFRDRLERALGALQEGGTWMYEYDFVRKDGTKFVAATTTTRVTNADGVLVGGVTLVRDISEEKALAQQKARFVAHASHELRTPITNLKTRVYLAKKQPEKLAEHLRVLEEVTERMQRLVEDLLDVSRFERGMIKLLHDDIHLQALINNVVTVQMPEADRKGLDLCALLPDQPILVRADRERITQVVTNLVTNAINYTQPGGRITVSAAPIYHDDRLCCALVEVEDTGIGIDEEHLPHLFQPFYRVTSKIAGTGLGLSIAKEIIELHGGKITVRSKPGAGSCFSFWLPLVETATIPTFLLTGV
ncbi:MAG: PAS domain S-box protein [Anaerolinea sp.]|nr:PAS domain S-box protein [Anaerolinea sp.]